MKFSYIGVKPDRSMAKGEIEASSDAAARALLEVNKVEVMMLQKKKLNFFSAGIKLGSVSDLQLAFFVKHLGIMLKAGLPIFEALVLLKDQATGPLKTILKQVLQEVSGGQKLSEVMKRYPKDFPPLIVELIRAGELTGTLEENLDYIATFMRKEIDLKRKVRGAMLYPSVILIAVLTLIISIGLFVLPQILPLFQSLDVELPFTTRMLLWFANFFQKSGVFLVIGLVAAVIFVPIILELPPVRPFSHRMYLRVPLFGPLVREVNLARFSRSTATLLNAGITIDTTLDIVNNIIRNNAYKRQVKNMKKVVLQGSPMSKAVEGSPFYFPTMITHMIKVGERSGNLAEALNYVGTYFEEDLDDKMKNLSTLLEPVLLIFIGLLVGGTAMAILGPIYSLTGNLR